MSATQTPPPPCPQNSETGNNTHEPDQIAFLLRIILVVGITDGAFLFLEATVGADSAVAAAGLAAAGSAAAGSAIAGSASIG